MTMTKSEDEKTLMDERSAKVEKDLEESEIINYFQTALHEGRHMSAIQMANGSIYFKQTSHHVPELNPNVLLLSQETFSFILETFLHAEKEFSIDRKKNLAKLTGGTGKIKYKKTLSGY